MDYPKTDWALEQLVNELVQMHKDTAIDLADWPKALVIVKRYFRVETKLEFTYLKDKEKSKMGIHSKYENEKYKHRPNC